MIRRPEHMHSHCLVQPWQNCQIREAEKISLIAQNIVSFSIGTKSGHLFGEHTIDFWHHVPSSIWWPLISQSETGRAGASCQLVQKLFKNQRKAQRQRYVLFYYSLLFTLSPKEYFNELCFSSSVVIHNG